MRRIGIILVFCTLWATDGFAVSRTSATTRTGTTTQKIRTQSATKTKTVRITTPQTKTVSRSATTQRSVKTRNNNVPARTGTVARATTDTRTGAEYEQCKSAYFTCMDQFCQLKNDDYRRCSCSDRITSLQSARDNLQQAAEQLTVFNENLDIVGKTAAQAAAMNTASDGELAMTKDTSASKALLTAIMNSIRNTDSRVEHSKLSDLNSLDLSFDVANTFGTMDVGQTIASYNGQALYSAVYPQCRSAVKSSCNDAALQRAINAYLMAIEQDCNTVQTAITNKQKETHAAIRESSSMLDMARAENHKNHNSDDNATCLANVESAILSEEVCGANYHKCLDNGEYIDVTTGSPISGVVDFYKLGTLLTFSTGRNNADQKLAQNPNNRTFVTTFEKRVKQFAEPALDKCLDDADTVWTDYLNKAMLDIYYAQQSKVNEIKQGCFDFVSACYMNGDTAMTNAMQGLVTAQTTTLKPDVLQLNKSLCSDYIASCNNMFDGNIVKDYIDNRHNTDSLTACRAVVQQCFDNYGGTNYENFYYPSSGLFSIGEAPRWFSLYNKATGEYESECAKQLASIDACKDKETVEAAFGGFDYYPNTNNIYGKYAYARTDAATPQNRLLRSSGVATEVYNQIIDILQTQCSILDGKFTNVQNLELYSDNYNPEAFCEATFHNTDSLYNKFYEYYSVGKNIRTCIPLYTRKPSAGVNAAEMSISTTPQSIEIMPLVTCMNQIQNENMCPHDYTNMIDVQSWGACLCWENGGRRSNNGTSTRCTASFPVHSLLTYDVNTDNTIQQSTKYGLNNSCNTLYNITMPQQNSTTGTIETDTSLFTLWEYNNSTSSELPTEQDWCTASVNSNNQVCPFGTSTSIAGKCNDCREGWAKKTRNNKQFCCPSDYILTSDSNFYFCCRNVTSNSNQTYTVTTPTSMGATELEFYCCPSGYTFNGNVKKCTNNNDSTDTVVSTKAITAWPTADDILNSDFPKP